jgi:NAD(P)-dependent dehydrogenase (short-subunit alcohol dehydrogenase family)
MRENIFSLNNKTAIVTGALGLLGKQHCLALSEAGANVVVCDLNEEKCVEFAKTLNSDSVGVALDVTNIESLNKAKDQILKEYDRIDVLVNNAAINDMFEDPQMALEQSRFENYSLEAWRRSLDVNITGVFLCSQVFGIPMVERKRGSIINIASTYGIVAPDQSIYRDSEGRQVFFKSAAYPTTKGAVISFTHFLAAYWGKQNIRVNALSPGGVENGQDEFFRFNYSQRTPLGRMSLPTDYKGAVVFLASDASAYMTGTNLVVDGGWTAW